MIKLSKYENIELFQLFLAANAECLRETAIESFVLRTWKDRNHETSQIHWEAEIPE